MLVETVQHGRLVFKQLQQLWAKTGRKYGVIDTETRAIRPFPKDDALTIGRACVRIWSLCYNGASYAFLTSDFSSRYPTMREWGELLLPFFSDPTITWVAHNWNYDANVFFFDANIETPACIFDTMLGAWAAAEFQPKGLKDRAPLFGRSLRETKTVDFSDKEELAEYAEQDVVVTEELYCAQVFGKVVRPLRTLTVDPFGRTTQSRNPFFQGPFCPEYQHLSPFKQAWVRFLEIPVLRSTIRAERKGFPLDLNELRKIRVEVLKEKHDVLKQMFQAAGSRFNPNSGRDLARIVDILGIDYPFKTKKGAPSFTAENLGKVENSHPFFRLLMTYKGLEKLTSVYIGSEPCSIGYTNDCGVERWINSRTGAVHATAGTIEAVTGRGSSSRPNLQQIPSRKDRFGIRKIFTANPIGQVVVPKFRLHRSLCVLDYSQLELRIMALLSKDPAMTKILSDPKGDIHQHTADEFGVPRDPQAKNLNFLLLYGGQEYMLARELSRFGVPTSEATANQYKLKHWEVYPRVKEKREEWCAEHQRNGYIKLFFGRTRTLDDADWSSDYSTHRAETRLANNAVQGTGQDCLKASIVRADFLAINPDREFPKRVQVPKLHRAYLADRAQLLEKHRKVLRRGDCRYLLQVHDEVIFSCVPSAAEECVKILADIMTWFHYFPPQSKYTVPLVAEGGVGPNWKAAKAKDALYHVKTGFDHFNQFAA